MIDPLKERVDLSIVIPCFNEEEVLFETFRRIIAVCEEMPNLSEFEIVFVNDGSRDTTWSKIEGLVHLDSHVVGVNLSRNFGHQLALTAGLELARGERILILDADLQDPPEILPDMMKAMDEGADVVYGRRIKREGESWFKEITARCFYRLLNKATDFSIPLDTGDFRLISRRVNEALCNMQERQRFIRGMVAWLGYKQVEFPYVRERRFAGTTKYSLSKMLSFSLDAITSFSNIPIRISVFFSFLIGLVSIALLCYVLFSWIIWNTIPGWASLGVIITFIGAVQLLILGITGEYVGRIYMESKIAPFI